MKYRLFAYTYRYNLFGKDKHDIGIENYWEKFYYRLPPPPPATITQFFPSNLQAITYISVKYRLCNLMHNSEAALYVCKSKASYVMGGGGGA